MVSNKCESEEKVIFDDETAYLKFKRQFLGINHV